MSPERERFLDELIVALIENFHTLTWFRTDDYDCPEDGPVSATIVDDEGKRHAITRATMRRGIDVIRTARLDPDSAELVNADTGQRLYASPAPPALQGWTGRERAVRYDVPLRRRYDVRR